MVKHANIVILAGGLSSRMKSGASAAGIPAAEIARHAKAMLPVGADGTPFLTFLLRNIHRAGFRSVVIVTGAQDSSIRDHFERDGHAAEFRGMTIRYAVQSIPADRTKPLGTADALLQGLTAAPEWSGSSVIVCNSDNLYSGTALRRLLVHPAPNAAVSYDSTALRFPQERIAQFAILQQDAEGFLTRIIEKPSPEEWNTIAGADGRVGVSMNAWKFDYDAIVPILAAVPTHPVRQEKELTEAVAMLLCTAPRCVRSLPIAEHVPDLTHPEDIARVTAEISSPL